MNKDVTGVESWGHGDPGYGFLVYCKECILNCDISLLTANLALSAQCYSTTGVQLESCVRWRESDDKAYTFGLRCVMCVTFVSLWFLLRDGKKRIPGNRLINHCSN